MLCSNVYCSRLSTACSKLSTIQSGFTVGWLSSCGLQDDYRNNNIIYYSTECVGLNYRYFPVLTSTPARPHCWAPPTSLTTSSPTINACKKNDDVMHGVVMRDNNIIFRVLTFCGSTLSSFRALVKKAAEGLPITWAVSPVAYCWEGEDRVIKIIIITQHKPHWLFIAYFHSLHEWSNIQCQFRTVLVVSTAAKQNIYSTVYDEGNLSLNINFDIYKYEP